MSIDQPVRPQLVFERMPWYQPEMTSKQGTPKVDSENALPLVGIVLVSYSSTEQIVKCLDSLIVAGGNNFFVTIIDNNSPDGSGPFLADRLKNNPFRLSVVISPENRGFAAGANIGIRQAMTEGASLIWLLNPDTICRPGALSSLIEAYQANPNAAAFGSKVVYSVKDSTGTDIIWGAGGTVDRHAGEVTMRGTGEADRGQFDLPERCGYLPGCSLLITDTAIKAIGYLPEDYFLYFEETDWCVQASNRGLELIYVPASVVEHDVGEGKMQQAYIVFYYNRNRRRFWLRFGGKSVRQNILKKIFIEELPASIRGFLDSPDKNARRIFSAHILSIVDLFLPGVGRRLMFRG
jgi:GT2 family glycosyltransferase